MFFFFSHPFMWGVGYFILAGGWGRLFSVEAALRNKLLCLSDPLPSPL